MTVRGSNLNFPSNPPTKLRFFGKIRAVAEKSDVVFFAEIALDAKNAEKRVFINKFFDAATMKRVGIDRSSVAGSRQVRPLVFRIISRSVVGSGQKSERSFVDLSGQFRRKIRIDDRSRIKGCSGESKISLPSRKNGRFS